MAIGYEFAAHLGLLLLLGTCSEPSPYRVQLSASRKHHCHHGTCSMNVGPRPAACIPVEDPARYDSDESIIATAVPRLQMHIRPLVCQIDTAVIDHMEFSGPLRKTISVPMSPESALHSRHSLQKLAGQTASALSAPCSPISILPEASLPSVDGFTSEQLSLFIAMLNGGSEMQQSKAAPSGSANTPPHKMTPNALYKVS